MLSECEQLKVNAAASQLPVKQQLEAVYINNAGHQLAGRRTDLAYQTWAMMAIFRMRARPVHITMFNLATRQGKTAQGMGCAANKRALQQLPLMEWQVRAACIYLYSGTMTYSVACTHVNHCCHTACIID